jgi:hypothetical protein
MSPPNGDHNILSIAYYSVYYNDLVAIRGPPQWTNSSDLQNHAYKRAGEYARRTRVENR